MDDVLVENGINVISCLIGPEEDRRYGFSFVVEYYELLGIGMSRVTRGGKKKSPTVR